MIQILLHNLKMDPLVSLHYYAPVCAIINLFFLPFTEGLQPFYQLKDLGVLVLVSNAAVAFLLNVAAVFLVGVASSLVLTLSGVFKVRVWLSLLFFTSLFRSCPHGLSCRLGVGFWLMLLIIMYVMHGLFLLLYGNSCHQRRACRPPSFLLDEMDNPFLRPSCFSMSSLWVIWFFHVQYHHTFDFYYLRLRS